MKRFTTVALFIFFFSQLYSQTALQDRGFLHYLVKNKMHDEAALFIHHVNDSTDTLNYLTGEYYFNLKKFDSASFFFKRVNVNAGLYTSAFKYADISSALNNRSFPQIQKACLEFPPDQQELINDRITSANSFKKKSSLTAGLLSTAVPGLGKVYAGKPRQGLSSFIMVVLLGLNAWDGYRHEQLNSPQFYIFGGLCALFYGGNIWGSAAEVKTQNKNFDDQINKDIIDIVSSNAGQLLY